MKQKMSKILSYLLQVILTALASAGIALLQNYLMNHGVNAGVELNPTDTGIIGSAVASSRIALSNLRNFNI